MQGFILPFVDQLSSLVLFGDVLQLGFLKVPDFVMPPLTATVLAKAAEEKRNRTAKVKYIIFFIVPPLVS